MTGLRTGVAYKFKVSALNFNGAGELSQEVTFYSCLPPTDILPPQYVSSTETTLYFSWSEPQQLNGCPIQGFNLNILDGLTEASSFVEPHINTFEIMNQNADDAKLYTIWVEAITAAGSVLSGTN